MKNISNIEDILTFIESNNICLVAIKTDTCSVCEPIIKKTEMLLAHYPNIPSIKVTIEQTPEFTGKYIVFSAPTILLFVKAKERLRQSGFINFEVLKKELELWSTHIVNINEDI